MDACDYIVVGAGSAGATVAHRFSADPRNKVLLQAFYSVRSERQLMERVAFGLLFRWFIGIGIDDPAWGHPSSFTRRFVPNLEAWYGSGPGEPVAHTNLLVYRSRTTLPEGGFYIGERRDLLRRDGGGLRLARREVRLDHTVVFGGPVSTLF